MQDTEIWVSMVLDCLGNLKGDRWILSRPVSCKAGYTVGLSARAAFGNCQHSHLQVRTQPNSLTLQHNQPIFRFSTKVAAVGTPYWMAPECLNDEIYTEIADVFSYGIILCEMIGRIDADPDYMPRTSTFGLDYVRFSELCPLDTPVDFLKLAFRCCLVSNSV